MATSGHRLTATQDIEQGLAAQHAAGLPAPIYFLRMRTELGDAAAIAQLLRPGDASDGFHRLVEAGLVEHTMEAIALRHPEHFTQDALEVARWRVDHPEDA